MNYILSIGINDYRNCAGGTNKVIMAQQKLFRQHGYGYIFICPVRKNKKMWEIIINNRFYNVRSTMQLLLLLYKFQLKKKYIREIHIHHLITASINEIDQVLSHIGGNIKYYIHDYFLICPSVKLMRNDTVFCGSEEMTARKCEGCKYYQLGIKENMQLKELITRYEDRITFIAPSDTAKEVWIKAYKKYRDKIVVIYHQTLQGEYTGNKNLIKNKIKVGYLGEPSYAKGWETWKKIIEKFLDKKYQFVYFGKDKQVIKGMSCVNVDFRNNLNAMVYALRKKEVDCVILWSLWAETYSYTYYESLASNTFIITNRKSGNIASQVKIRKNGIVLENENELIELFRNFNLLKKYINRYKQNGQNGPDRLLENVEILRYIAQDVCQNVSMIENRTITSEERMLTIYYVLLQGFYYVRKVFS